jgi:hypothetical protein
MPLHINYTSQLSALCWKYPITVANGSYYPIAKTQNMAKGIGICPGHAYLLDGVQVSYLGDL